MLFLTIFLVQSSYSADYSIVFVHIGKLLPVYLQDALEQARLFNPNAQIILIANQAPIIQNDKQIQEVLDSQNIKTVFCEDLAMSKNHQIFLRETPLDKNYRDGFWRYATERFFYLEELMIQESLRNVFHIENDNMLYVNLEDLLPVFMQYTNIAAIFDSDTRCIPNFMYFAHSKALSRLMKYWTINVGKHLNDMEIPLHFKNQYGRSVLDYLPVLMPDYLKKYQLKSYVGEYTAKDPYVFCNKFELFQSVFDGAALGQYLGGIDPRNGESKPGYINETCLFNPSYYDYTWIIDEEGRSVPYLIFDNKLYRINNLHLHSKNLKDFKS